jgi:hypothetical protein
MRGRASRENVADAYNCLEFFDCARRRITVMHTIALRIVRTSKQ